MELERRYNIATTVQFPLVSAGGNDFRASLTFVSSDILMSRDNGARVTASAQPSGIGGGAYVLPITAGQLAAKTVDIYVVDQGTKAWEDQAVKITTYGSTAGLHAFDRNARFVNVSALESHALNQVSAEATDALQGYDVASALDTMATARASAVFQTVLENYGVASAGDASSLATANFIPMFTTAAQQYSVASAAAVTTAAMSATISQVIQAYGVASAGDAAGISSAANIAAAATAIQTQSVVTAADAQLRSDADASALFQSVLTNYGVASAGVPVTQAEVSSVMQGALTNYGVASALNTMATARASAVFQTVLQNYNVASAGVPLTQAEVSAVVDDALNNYAVASAGDVPTEAEVSAVVDNALNNYGVVSAAGGIARVSAISSAGIGITTPSTAMYRQQAGTVWRISYASARSQVGHQEAVTPRSGLGLMAKLVNKVAVSGTDLEIFHEDDSTNFFDQTITEVSASSHIQGLDTQ